jgi:hypothetical protein
MRAGEAKSKGVPHSWTLAHLAMRHASGSAAANAWLHRAGVGCGSCVLEIVVSSRPVTFTRVHTRHGCRAPIAHRSARTRRFVYARSPPFDPEFWTSVSGRVSAVRPSLRRPLEHSARSPRMRALALSPRALSLLSPLPLDRRSLVELRSQPAAASSAEVRGRRRCWQRRRAHLA